MIGSLLFETEMVMALARALNAALAGCGWPLPCRLEAIREGGAPRSLH
ncbi:MAG: hypothetical protein JSS35_04335 [Proteobacteria bacterium]|nr:hypothetical protein [Pseudomonadota bacterium]